MPIRIRHLALASLCILALSVPSTVTAQVGVAMGLLAVQADVNATPQEATPVPTTAEALEAVDRILALWPELVGTKPEGDPRYNVEDIGHIAQCSGVGFLVKGVMVSRMIGGMRKCGITIPANPTSGTPRPVDLDRNGEKDRAVTRAQLEALEEDTTAVRAYMDAMAAKIGKKAPVNANGLSVADWRRIRTVLKGVALLGK